MKDMDAVGIIQRISPGYWLGEAGAAAAGMGMSKPVSELIGYWRRNGITPQRLEEIRHNDLSSSGALPGQADVLTGMAQTMLERAGQGASGLIPNPFSLIDVGRGIGEVQDLHKYLIQRMADAGAPGFEHTTVQIDGKPVQIWVDASSAAEHRGSQPNVYVDYGTQGAHDDDPSSSRARAASLKTQISALTRPLMTSIESYLAAHPFEPSENYARDLEHAITDGRFGERPEIIHPAHPHPAPPPADSTPRLPQPTPPGPAPLY